MRETMRDVLIRVRNEWLNEYLTVAQYGEHHGLTEAEARVLLDLANQVASHPHPEY
jgi:hypothetical protein